MLRKPFVIITIVWWLSVSSLTRGENILFLNLFKDDELNSDVFKSENLDSNLESDLTGTYSFDEYNESMVSNKSTLNNTGLELIDVAKSHPRDWVDEEVSPTSSVSNVVTEDSEDRKAKFTKHTTSEMSHTNALLSKAIVEGSTPLSKGCFTVLPERSEEEGLYPFVRFCFDMIASFMQGVMKGIMSIGDASTNSNPTGVLIDYSQSSTSRIRKRDLHNTEASTVISTIANLSQMYNNSSEILDVKFNVNTSFPQHMNIANLRDPTTNNSNSKHSMESILPTELNTSLHEIKNSTLETLSPSGKKSYKVQNGKINLLTNNSKKNTTEHSKNNTEEIGNGALLAAITSTPASPFQDSTIWTNMKREDQELNTPLDDSTEEESSNAFLLNDFVNKQNDPTLKEFVQRQFATAQFYPHPHEGEYDSKKETSIGIIVMAIGGVVLVIASVGLAAAFRFQLISIGRNRFGNLNPSRQRTTMA